MRVMQIGSLSGNLFSVPVLTFGLPQIVDHLQSQHKVGGVDKDDSLFIGILAYLGDRCPRSFR